MTTWSERITAARKAGAFTDEDKDDASKWISCAVGEQHALHPDEIRYNESESIKLWDGRIILTEPSPVDDALARLGAAFYEEVAGQNPTRARQTYTRIKARVRRLAAKVPS